jgi:hypothetical protein
MSKITPVPNTFAVGRLGESAHPEAEKVREILQKLGGSKLQPLATRYRYFCSDIRRFASNLEGLVSGLPKAKTKNSPPLAR